MKRLLGLGLSLACLGTVWAQEAAVPAIPPESAPVATRDLPLWEVGVFGVGISQLAYPGSNQQVKRVLALPYLVYRGDVLRADDDGAGLRAVRTERFELDVSTTGAFGAGSKKLEAREGMRRLGTLAEFGPVGRFFLTSRSARDRVTFELPVRGVFDAGDGLRRKGVSVEPELGMERRVKPGQTGYGVSVSALFGDKRLGSTFYGVLPSEATANRPAFNASSGLIAVRLNGTVMRDITPDLRVILFGRFETVSGGANRASPLIMQTSGATYGIGLAYTLKRSAARSSD